MQAASDWLNGSLLALPHALSAPLDKIQLHPFWLKQVIWQNALLDLIRVMFMKMAVTQLIMDLSEKFFRLHDPQTLPPSGKYHYFIPPKGPGSTIRFLRLIENMFIYIFESLIKFCVLPADMRNENIGKFGQT